MVAHILGCFHPLVGHGAQPLGTLVPGCQRREPFGGCQGWRGWSKDGSGQDGAPLRQLSPRAGGTQLPGCSLVNWTPHAAQGGCPAVPVPRKAGPCPGNLPHSIPAPWQILRPPAPPHRPGAVGAVRDAVVEKPLCQGKGCSTITCSPAVGFMEQHPCLAWGEQGCSRGSRLWC